MNKTPEQMAEEIVKETACVKYPVKIIASALTAYGKEQYRKAVTDCMEEFDELLEIRSSPDFRQIVLKAFGKLAEEKQETCLTCGLIYPEGYLHACPSKEDMEAI